jgi:ribonuclease HI
MLTHTVKNAWRSGKVAAALFLDIQGAFPNTCKDQLLHNMKDRRIPPCYTNLIDNMLSNRKTRIVFDDFTSDPININNGTTQGCPLSMILYAFYNAPLILTASETNETALGFVDDSMFLAIAKTLPEAHHILKNMMERSEGGFDWSKTHNSPFEPNKLALMNFPRVYSDPLPPDLILSKTPANETRIQITVKTANKYKYLGIILEPNLRWSLHHQKVLARAIWWTNQVARLSKISGGLPPKRIRQLYTTVAIPIFTYAADVWFTDIHPSSSGLIRLGSVALVKKLSAVQRQATRLITGSLRTAAGDVLESHANLLPIELLFKKILFRSATRLASLPPTHPLFQPIRNAAKRYVKKHRSPLHNLFHLTKVTPNSIESISTVRRRPNYKKKFSTHIAQDKEKALTAANTLHKSKYTVYSDGSGFEGGAGAAAVMYINQVESQSLWLHLGPMSGHTVYEGELVGLCLAFHILLSLPFTLRSRVIIGTDNQAAVKALSNQRPHPAHYLLDYIHDSAEKLCIKHNGNIDLQIHWTPGHQGFIPNERADSLAKQAAEGASSATKRLPPPFRNKPLPLSIPAIRLEHLKTLRKDWKSRWKKSARYPLSHSIDKSLPSNKFLQLIDKLSRSQSAILAQLRTGHAPLNQHLFRTRCVESPVCPHCGGLVVETVRHYLLQCPHYQQERHRLRRKLKRSANSISFLLSNPLAIKPLLKYITATKRFKTLSNTH